MPTSYFAVRRVRGPAWNAALSLRSQAQWDEHALFMNGLAAEGLIVLGGPIGDGAEVLLIFDCDSEETVRSRLAADPWSKADLLRIARIEPWTVLLDGRRPR